MCFYKGLHVTIVTKDSRLESLIRCGPKARDWHTMQQVAPDSSFAKLARKNGCDITWNKSNQINTTKIMSSYIHCNQLDTTNRLQLTCRVVCHKSRETELDLRAASHYTISSLRRPAMAPHDAVADRTSCIVRPSAILSVTILNNRRASQFFATILYDDPSWLVTYRVWSDPSYDGNRVVWGRSKG